MAEGRITWWDRLDFIPQAMRCQEKRGAGTSMIQPVCEGNAPGGCKGTNSSGKWLKAGREMTASVLPLEESGDQSRVAAGRTGGELEKWNPGQWQDRTLSLGSSQEA